MMKTMVVSKEEFGSIRMINQDDRYWFVAKDICVALGISSTATAIKRLNDYDHLAAPVQTKGGVQSLQVISPNGVMEIINGSRKKNKAKFREWLVNDIFPTYEIKYSVYDVNETISSAMSMTVYNRSDLGDIRVITENEDPWFVAADVCSVLGIADTAQAMERIDDDEKSLRKVRIANNTLSMWCVNESGLYNLVLESNKPEAKKFKRWITHDVLPLIRKHGTYLTPNTIDQVLNNHDSLVDLAMAMKAEQPLQPDVVPNVCDQKVTVTSAYTAMMSKGLEYMLAHPREAAAYYLALADEQNRNMNG